MSPVFVHEFRSRDAILPTEAERALLLGLREKGVTADNCQAALVSSGVTPERAAQLAELVGPEGQVQRAAATVSGIAGAFGWVTLAIVFSVAKRPLREWLHRLHPGTEWIVSAAVPILVGVYLLWSFARARRRIQDAAQGTTRADGIDNKPIG